MKTRLPSQPCFYIRVHKSSRKTDTSQKKLHVALELTFVRISLSILIAEHPTNLQNAPWKCGFELTPAWISIHKNQLCSIPQFQESQFSYSVQRVSTFQFLRSVSPFSSSVQFLHSVTQFQESQFCSSVLLFCSVPPFSSLIQFLSSVPQLQVSVLFLCPVLLFRSSVPFLCSVAHFSSSVPRVSVLFLSPKVLYRSVPQFSSSIQFLISVPPFSYSVQFLCSVSQFSSSVQFLSSDSSVPRV